MGTRYISQFVGANCVRPHYTVGTFVLGYLNKLAGGEIPPLRYEVKSDGYNKNILTVGTGVPGCPNRMAAGAVPGRNYKLLPALATNSPPDYSLNASRPQRFLDMCEALPRRAPQRFFDARGCTRLFSKCRDRRPRLSALFKASPSGRGGTVYRDGEGLFSVLGGRTQFAPTARPFPRTNQ